MFTKPGPRQLLAMAVIVTLLAMVVPPASANYASVQDKTVWKPVDGEVFALWQVGDRMFAGGDFTGVKHYLSDVNPVNVKNLAAFDVNTGALIQSFNPVFDGAVREIISSSDDSRIFVGGDFTSVNGLPNTARLVALDPMTGAVDTNFLGNANGSVYDLEIHGNDLYVGGKFSRVGTGFGGRLARIDANTGKRDLSFNPLPDYYVDAMDIPLAGDRLYVGGTFQTIDGRDGNQFVALDLETGATVTAFRTPYDQRVFDIAATDDRIIATYGMLPNAVAVFDRNGTLVQRHPDGDGDYQSLALNGRRTVVGSHSNLTGGFSRPGLASLVTQTGAVDSLRVDVFAPRGVWDIYPTGGALWLGGDIRQVDGSNAGRMVRIAMAPGQIAPSTPNVSVISKTLSSITLDWNDSTDADGSVVEYRVIRSGEQIAVVTSSQFTDNSVVSGVNYAYNIEAIDNARNVSGRTPTIVTSTLIDTRRPTTPGHVTVTNIGLTSIALRWMASTDDYGPIRYVIERNGSVVATTSNRTYTDTGLNPQTTYSYTVRAIDSFDNQSDAGPPGLATTLPSSQPVPIDIIDFGATWRYDASGNNLQRAWIAPAYNDRGWRSGQAEFGFGDGDEATVVPRPPRPSLTTYFRRSFNIADADAVLSLNMRVIRDDGFAVYINGVEVGRDNLTASADYDTNATVVQPTSTEAIPVQVNVNQSVLVTGTNTIAVEMHNANYTSSDLSFDLEFGATIGSTGNGDTQAPTSPRITTLRSTGTSLTLSWEAATDNVGVTVYRVYRANTLLASVSGTTLSYEDATVQPENIYSYVVFAADAANNFSPASNTVEGSLSDDSQPADSTITSVVTGGVLQSGPLTFSGSATDDASGVAHVYMTVRDRGSLQWLQPNGSLASPFALLDTNLGSPGALSTSWTYNANLPVGEYSIETRAVDTDGNIETSRPWVKFFTSTTANDTNLPAATITNPSTYHQVFATGPIGLAGLVTDDSSGVDQVRVSIQNRTTKDWLQTNATFDPAFNLIDATVAAPGSKSTTWTLPISVPPGDYAVEVRAIDLAGNVQRVRPRVPFSVNP